MKVIFLKDVAGLGRKFEAKEVSDGYFRNFLLPRNLAKAGTKEALRELAVLSEKQEAEEKKLKEHLEALARKISETSIEFVLRADDTGHAFGAVSKEMVLASLREHGLVTKERVDAVFSHPLKEFGPHKVNIDLKKGVAATLTIILKPDA